MHCSFNLKVFSMTQLQKFRARKVSALTGTEVASSHSNYGSFIKDRIEVVKHHLMDKTAFGHCPYPSYQNTNSQGMHVMSSS